MSDARRGQVWLTDFGVPVGREQGKIRPAVVVSSDGWNAHAATVTVLPMTRTSHDYPTRVEIEVTEQNGLDETSSARCEDIRAISERRLVRRLGHVDPVVMLSVSRTLRLFLDA